MTLSETTKHLEEKLEPHEVKLMLEQLLGQAKHVLLLKPQFILSQEQLDTLEGWLKRRLAGEPLQHILAKAHFYGLELKVSKEVLVPRPETETLVEQVLDFLTSKPEACVLDVATGSGAIALALKAECSTARINASDISASALRLAKENASTLALDVDFYQSDLLIDEAVNQIASKADVITANLPYLPTSDKRQVSQEVQHDPELALYSGEDGLDLFRCFEQQAFRIMKNQANCWLELDPRNVNEAFDLCANWAERYVTKDLLGRDRFLRLVR